LLGLCERKVPVRIGESNARVSARSQLRHPQYTPPLTLSYRWQPTPNRAGPQRLGTQRNGARASICSCYLPFTLAGAAQSTARHSSWPKLAVNEIVQFFAEGMN
jgi:hypothetical protein